MESRNNSTFQSFPENMRHCSCWKLSKHYVLNIRLKSQTKRARIDSVRSDNQREGSVVHRSTARKASWNTGSTEAAWQRLQNGKHNRRRIRSEKAESQADRDQLARRTAKNGHSNLTYVFSNSAHANLSRVSYFKYGKSAADRTWTYDRLVNSQPLYRAELRRLKFKL